MRTAKTAVGGEEGMCVELSKEELLEVLGVVVPDLDVGRDPDDG